MISFKADKQIDTKKARDRERDMKNPSSTDRPGEHFFCVPYCAGVDLHGKLL